jgi:hypothetical protein
MKEITATSLNFVRSKAPLPTVEVDLDSIPAEQLGYSDLVARALHAFAKTFPSCTATLYVYQGPSSNFHEPTFSAFFGVAGCDKEALLETILRAFRDIAGVKAKMSDYIDSTTAFTEFHVENGTVWRPLDAATWFSDTTDSEEEDSVNTQNMFSSSQPIGHENQVARSRSARFRAARSDTTIGVIVGKIEEVFGLPNGSVVLCDPEGKRIRSDAKIGTLRKRWEQ